jgi:hypothetical protein
MSPEFHEQWKHIIEDVEKSRIPIQFIKKLVLKLKGKRQHTINIKKLIQQGLEPDQLEEVVAKKISEYEDLLVSVEFILDIQSIAEAVQPETDKILSGL